MAYAGVPHEYINNVAVADPGYVVYGFCHVIAMRQSASWTRPRDVYGIIAFQSTGLRECMGKASF